MKYVTIKLTEDQLLALSFAVGLALQQGEGSYYAPFYKRIQTKLAQAKTV